MIARVLGPLRVTMNGDSVVPAARKAKKLLAVLILNHGRVVQRDTIERELWGLDVPMSASTGIQNSVMQIRKSIALSQRGAAACRSPKEILVTEPTGYRLDVPCGELDVSHYRRLVAEAGDAAERGDLTLASAQLNSALKLWRDAPLADVPAGPVLRAHVRQLEEGRRSVLSRRVALDLRLGRYSEVIGELHALAALNPYDETLHEYLILALYLSGRRNDALAAYQDVRTAMADGTGLEPSPQLRRLQQGILSGDGSLDEHLERRLLKRPGTWERLGQPTGV
ncbi:AfsR/SARP family transcriptional regulator [Streptomyces sp. TRM49041]|uniref:AfsR/SARP family transcriptional regulator n=1 Tax=Streptomyces sp. TRM49041 TaxID=2603216 RepID=UPI0011EC48F8|nr:AfsR/SARP family transcriptional regulator [Streptomyces sp. TRM49041]